MEGCSKIITANKTKEQLTVFNINVDRSIPTDKKIKMNFSETKGAQKFNYQGKIKRRGGSSIKHAKHSYEIDLQKDISLSYLPKDDDWILNANYIDKTFLRHVLSYEIFSSMRNQNITSKNQYVELNLNGKYNGLYVLMEKLDKSSLKISEKDSTAMIFKEPHIFREKYPKQTQKGPSNFHQQTYPKIKINDKTAVLEDLRNFILTTNDNDFTNGISDILDINNIIDWHLLLLITNNSDGILKNFYLYKTDFKTPIRIAPWDYDHGLGRDGDNELNIDSRPLNIEISILFKRLLKFDWYKTILYKRWGKLNKRNILSVSGLKNKVLAKKLLINKAVNKNFKIWPIDGAAYYDANNFDKEINIMLEFIDLRHNRLSKYFDEIK